MSNHTYTSSYKYGISNQGVDMNRKFFLYSLLLITSLLLTGVASVQATTEAVSSKDGLVTVLNPAVSTKLADRVPLAPRLDTLEGKTIYMVDDNWGGMGENGILHDEMEAWFREHMPGVKIVRRIKRGNFVTDDPGLWKEIADNGGDGVIIGVAG